MGGQTALNLAVALSDNGALERHNVELIGAKLDAINKAEDRELFKQAMTKLGFNTPISETCKTMDECWAAADLIGQYPIIIRPAFTLGGTGGGIAYNPEEFKQICTAGMDASLTDQVLVEKSLLGWKEYELEVMRDLADNVVIICSIENIDPMGVHTGDSITVAPAQTLTDKEYQRLRDISVDIIREIGVECGGSNVQMAVNPVDGEVMIIEMNPRVSRSSALASKATGFPIAKMAAKLSVGYTLDQIPNDITQMTPASFEPSIDYVVTKIPRFAFEKFPGAEPTLTTQMKSVGECMAIGRTFQESFQKACRGLETGAVGFSAQGMMDASIDMAQLKYNLRTPNPERIYSVCRALQLGMSQEEVIELTSMDPWWVSQLAEISEVESWLMGQSIAQLTETDWRNIKRMGFGDKQIALATGADELEVRKARVAAGVSAVYKKVDTCAAEFNADTPYFYSTYEDECEARPTDERKVLILGGGPNRIGQGIEFDYCCCHASFSLSKAGYETIMMNSNPETVSTDYDTSDRLYFEPLTVEDVLNVIEKERPEGIIVQFGGQTPLKLAVPLQRYLKENKIPVAYATGGDSDATVKIWGTQPEAIDRAEDRDQFATALKKLGIMQPAGGIARTVEQAERVARDIGYPVVVRPSYVLGGRAMEIVRGEERLRGYIEKAIAVDPNQPILVDKYLEDAVEIDVDSLADKDGNVVIGGIMEHIEQAGVHSGDSACTLPAQTVPADALQLIRNQTVALARELGVVGLMNCQYAVKWGPGGSDVYILEANPRASRTVPFVSKAIGRPLATYASLVMSGKTLEEIGFTEEIIPPHVAVKEAVLPFDKFAGADTLLGPEMRSTGEVMGIDRNLPMAFAKAELAAMQRLPKSGTVFVSVNDRSKGAAAKVASKLAVMGFSICATEGTASAIAQAGVECETVLKLHEGRPNIGDRVSAGEISLMLIISSGDERDLKDGRDLRRSALQYKVPLITTIAGAKATAAAIESMADSPIEMLALQDYYEEAGW